MPLAPALSEPKNAYRRKIQTLQRCQSTHSIAKDCRGSKIRTEADTLRSKTETRLRIP